jgi:cellulose synthase (UDP-forming)
MRQKGISTIFVLWVISAGFTAWMTTLSIPHAVQVYLAGGFLLVMAILLAVANRRMERGQFLDHIRAVILVLGAVLTLRYISWRIVYTINFHDVVSYIGAIALLVAEIYGITMYFLGSIINVKPLYRPIRELDETNLPSVDILIPSYNEDDSILEVTLLAATQIDYPADLVTVYLLDDGGTDAKRAQADDAEAAVARNRQRRLQALCDSAGAVYMTREDNRDAKAGNINAALPRISGELLLMLDADHVPSADFLKNTVGEFQVDANLFLVQTPHRFITPDPVEKNLEVHRKMPGESEIFYRLVQHGLDAWHSSFFCGSAAVLRKKHLDEIGGMPRQTVTEDAETSLALHGRGYRSVYVGKPMVFGLQPETFSSFVEQRCRWAQGMVQLFLLKNPLLVPGLTPRQRFGYLNSTLFWFFSYARLIFLLAPCAYLLFGLKIYDADLDQFLIYAIPHLIGALICANLLFGRARWVLVSELYESVQSIFSSRAVTQALLNPRSPVFNVTDKGERLQNDFVSPMVGPFYVIFLMLLVSLVAGYFRYQFAPGQRDVIYITSGWALLNLFIIMGGLGVLLERRQLRKAPRLYLAQPVSGVLQLADVRFPCRLLDISMKGARVEIDSGVTQPLNLESGGVLEFPVGDELARLPVSVVRAHSTDSAVSLAFSEHTTECKRWIVAVGYGNSDNLAWDVESNRGTPGIISGLMNFLWLAVRHSGEHLLYLVKMSGYFLATGLRSVVIYIERLTRTVGPGEDGRREDDAIKRI